LRLLRPLGGVCAVALLVGSASLGHAQEAEQTAQTMQTAQAIPQSQEETMQAPRKKKRIPAEAYAAQGIGEGPIRFYPSIEFDGLASTNIRSSATKPKAGVGVQVKPSLRFASNWARHSWTGSASAGWQHATGVDASTVTGSIETAFRLDVLRGTTADFSTSYNSTQAGFENSQVPSSAAAARRDHSANLSAGITHDFGGLEASAKIALQRSIFEDVALVGGGTEINSDRNFWEPSIALRGSIGGRHATLKPFIELAYNPRFHDQTLDRNGQKRNSQGLTASAGLSFDGDALWSGEIALTDTVRSYDDANLKNANALGLRGRITWRPTNLTSIEATSGVALDETTLINVAATTTWSTGLLLTQALRDNLTAQAGATLALQNTGTGVDVTSGMKLGLDWQLNPNMSAGITYQGTWFNGDAANSDYDEQRLMTSIVLKR
jgi:hypothetical protein